MVKINHAIFFAGILFALTGCNEYRERRDTVTLGVGDAVEANKVTQIENPWPPEAQRKEINVDGERMLSVVKRYKAGEAAQPSELRPDQSKTEN
jgi:hypothetical protein